MVLFSPVLRANVSALAGALRDADFGYQIKNMTHWRHKEQERVLIEYPLVTIELNANGVVGFLLEPCSEAGFVTDVRSGLLVGDDWVSKAVSLICEQHIRPACA